ncbi:HIT family protein [Corynebacterium kozikiae]|uniref:HIT family protein n=1 Tax=Corynebacterium kozikiae TaxID=2968469 RepID=UPI00211C5D02|nr:HIT domain-containing protein [Corynebacterium sp. 76QC2CO]MCQ9342501.1 HIT domain-containing protein [Corynebacterium sp. 76QC2CO]
MGAESPNTASHGEPEAGPYVDQGVGTPDLLTRLWAPYRMAYIVKDAADSPGGSRRNPFVSLPEHSDEESLIVARGEHVYCVLNLYPYNPGHMLVVPYREVSELELLTEAESHELLAFAQRAIRALKEVSRPDAVNAGFNLGRASGGSVAQHLHMHIVPRWSGDANFMTVIDGTKVLPQTLKETRALLADAWVNLPPAPAAPTAPNDAAQNGEAHA